MRSLITNVITVCCGLLVSICGSSPDLEKSVPGLDQAVGLQVVLIALILHLEHTRAR